MAACFMLDIRFRDQSLSLHLLTEAQHVLQREFGEEFEELMEIVMS